MGLVAAMRTSVAPNDVLYIIKTCQANYSLTSWARVVKVRSHRHAASTASVEIWTPCNRCAIGIQRSHFLGFDGHAAQSHSTIGSPRSGLSDEFLSLRALRICRAVTLALEIWCLRRAHRIASTHVIAHVVVYIILFLMEAVLWSWRWWRRCLSIQAQVFMPHGHHLRH